MLIFKPTMDPNSRELYRGSKFIGRLLMHADRQPQIELMPLEPITIEEMKQVIDKYEAIQTQEIYGNEIEIKRD